MAEYLTLKEVASLLRVSNRTLTRWIRAGYIRPCKIGHTLRFERSRLLWQVEQLETTGGSRTEDPSLG
jgi:excisionase family DNA binding protein